MTTKILEKAGNMYWKLNSCSTYLNRWYIFYSDLFLNHPPYKIALTLNRILKSGNTYEKDGLKEIAKEIFNKMMKKLNIKKVQNMILGNGNYSEFDVEGKNTPKHYPFAKCFDL